MEEVSLDLGAHAELLGRLPDRTLYRHSRAVEGACVSAMVYLCHDEPAPPPLALQAGEVAAARWVPFHVLCDTSRGAAARAKRCVPYAFATLRARAVVERALERPLRVLPLVERLPAWLRRPLGLDVMYVPGMVLPVPGAGAGSVTPHDAPGLTFMLWGISFDVVSDLAVVRAGRTACRGAHALARAR